MKNIVLANRIKDVFIKIFERDNLKKAAIDFDSAQESRQLLVTLSKIAKLLHTTKQINVDTSLVQIRDALGFSAEDFAALIGDGSGGKSQLNSLTTKGLHIARLALEDELVSNPNLQVRPVLSKQLAAVELLLTKAASQIPGLKIVDVAGFSENQQVIMKFDMLYNVLRDYYKMPQKNLLNIVARKYDFSPFLRDAYRVQSSINRNPDPSAKRTGNSVPDFYVHEILKVAENIMDTTTPTIP